VERSLEVDLMLGARLAGEVRSGFQETTIKLVRRRNVEPWLSDILLSEMNAEIYLIVKSPLSVELHRGYLPVLTQSDSERDSSDFPEVTESPGDYVCRQMNLASSSTGPEAVILALMKLLEHSSWHVRSIAGDRLMELDSASAVTELCKLLSHRHEYVRHSSAFTLCMHGKEEGVPVLIKTIQFINYEEFDPPDYGGDAVMKMMYGWFDICTCADTMYALGKSRSEESISQLMRAINHSDEEDILQSAVAAL
jgi:hypothetical protein